MRLLTAGVSIFAVLALACGGGGSSDSDGSKSEPTSVATTASQATAGPTAATQTTISNAAAQQILQAAVPGSGDVPRGFMPTSTSYSTSLQASQSQQFQPQAEALAMYEKNKRILSYTASYSSNIEITQTLIGQGTLTFLNYDATLYNDETGAKAAYQFGLAHQNEAKQGVASTQGFANVKIVDGVGGNYGDESFTFRLTATATISGQTFAATYDVIGFRRGKILGVLLTGAAGSPSANTIGTLAKQFVTKTENALK